MDALDALLSIKSSLSDEDISLWYADYYSKVLRGDYYVFSSTTSADIATLLEKFVYDIASIDIALLGPIQSPAPTIAAESRDGQLRAFIWSNGAVFWASPDHVRLVVAEHEVHHHKLLESDAAT